jgi:tetratricopeptide (TPR) repeat protein
VAGPVADRLFGASFVFRHALLRDAAYASLTRAERSRLHVRFARWLEGVRNAEQAAEVVGRHYAAALGSAPRLVDEVEGLDRDSLLSAAGHWFERAAGSALRLAAHDAGRELALRALEHTPEDEPVLRARRLTLLGEATAFGFDMDEAARHLDEACATLRPVLPDGRAEFARAASIRVLIAFEQTRFAEGVDLATALLDSVGDDSDPPAARVLLGRARCMHGLTNRMEDTAPDCERVLEIARRFGDRELELDALTVLVAARAEAGVASGPEEWEPVESLARELHRWRTVAGALLNQRDESAPDAALALIERSVEVCREHGLAEGLVWGEYARAELLFERGHWDEALAAALRAVELGDSGGFLRATVRSWFVAVPIAAERHDRALLQRVLGWLDTHGPFPSSPFGLVMRAGIAVAATQNGLSDHTTFDGDILIRGAETEFGGSEWFAAVERVAAALLARGDRDSVEQVVTVAARWNAGPTTTALGQAHEHLIRAWLGEEEAARQALEHARAAGAPWWILRALDACGEADSDERRELARRLGI